LSSFVDHLWEGRVFYINFAHFERVNRFEFVMIKVIVMLYISESLSHIKGRRQKNFQEGRATEKTKQDQKIAPLSLSLLYQ